ncbi:MAG: transposase [Draconibacterium sp.]
MFPCFLEWKSCEPIEMNIQTDPIHLIVSMPPKMSLSQLMGILKGKAVIKIFKSYPQLRTKLYWVIIFDYDDTVQTLLD